MGNIYNIFTAQKIKENQMNRPLKKTTNNNLAYGKTPAQISSTTSQPKNIRKEPIQNQPKIFPKQQQPQISNQQIIIAKIHCIVMQELEFEIIWSKLQEILVKYIKFKVVFPQAINKQGQKIITNGSFIVYWLKIIQKSPCVNMNFIYKDIYTRYLPKIQKQKQYLYSYLQFIEQQSKANKSARQTLTQGSLKRQQINPNDKNIQFNPRLSYQSLQQKPKLTKSQIKQQIKTQQAILIDCLQINNIYLLQEVDIIGVIRQYANIFVIVQVKIKDNLKQVTCIGAKDQKKIDKDCIPILNKIQKQHQCLSYLHLQGKDPSQL